MASKLVELLEHSLQHSRVSEDLPQAKREELEEVLKGRLTELQAGQLKLSAVKELTGSGLVQASTQPASLPLPYPCFFLFFLNTTTATLGGRFRWVEENPGLCCCSNACSGCG